MGGRERAIRAVIAVADEERRRALSAAIEADPGVELAGAGAECEEATRLAARERPDVVVLDSALPGDIEGTTREITSGSSRTRVIVLTVADLEASYDMLHAGAAGLLARDASDGKVVETIRSVVEW